MARFHDRNQINVNNVIFLRNLVIYDFVKSNSNKISRYHASSPISSIKSNRSIEYNSSKFWMIPDEEMGGFTFEEEINKDSKMDILRISGKSKIYLFN